ncbi:MAG: hypothetical protein ACHRXM_01320 [Isosphaerales bacterium]
MKWRMVRMQERAKPGTLFVHFNGAAGNVTAGKYNDGFLEKPTGPGQSPG